MRKHQSLLTQSQNYLCLFPEHLKRLKFFCVCAMESLFYSTFDLKCFSIKKRKTTVSGTLPLPLPETEAQSDWNTAVDESKRQMHYRKEQFT